LAALIRIEDVADGHVALFARPPLYINALVLFLIRQLTA